METKESNAPYIINLINSIIGVSVLAMPFCLKKCGLILGLGLLIGMAWLTYVSCNMLISAAVAKRRRTYEYLAFYTVGPTGKFAVELSMIGFMLGICVAFYVIIGDLATAILQEQVRDTNPEKLRSIVIVFCALCVALPLGLMKNLSVLGYVGIFSMIFYGLFVGVMLANSVSSGFFSFAWLDKVHFFRPAGIFQCLPIFSLAYACQCQLFVVYDSLEDASITRMETIVAVSLKIVAFVYCTVAVLGYTTYIDSVDGNVLKNFSPNFILDLIKMGFAVSVVVGFPLMIFPCRQSIHTLFFSQQPTEGIASSKTYIEPFMFKAITLSIVLLTMMVALFIPNVETILGLTGATMGSFICFIFPGIIFTKASPKEETGIPKFVLTVGCILLVLCTYSNVYSATEAQSVPKQIEPIVLDPQLPNDAKADAVAVENKDHVPSKAPIAEVVDLDHRHEPPNPVEPIISDKDEDINDGDDFAKVPDQVVHPLPGNEVKKHDDNQNLLKDSHNADSEIEKQEKPAEVNNPDKNLKNPINNINNLNNLPKDNENPVEKEPPNRAPKENDEVPVQVNQDSELLGNIPVKKRPADTNVHKIDEPVKRNEPIKSDEKVEKLDTAQDTEKKEIRANANEIDQAKILEQLKEQQQKQQKLLQEEQHLINVLEQAENEKPKVLEEQNYEKVKRAENNGDTLAQAKEIDQQNNPIGNVENTKEKDNSVLKDSNVQVLQPNVNNQQEVPENPGPVVNKKPVQESNVQNINNLQNKEPIVEANDKVNPVPPQPGNNVLQKSMGSKDIENEHNRNSRDLHENLAVESELIQVTKTT